MTDFGTGRDDVRGGGVGSFWLQRKSEIQFRKSYKIILIKKKKQIPGHFRTDLDKYLPKKLCRRKRILFDG